MQVGMPVMRSDAGKLQLGVVLGSKREARELQVAVKTGSRLLPGARVSAQDCRCAAPPPPPQTTGEEPGLRAALLVPGPGARQSL